MKFDKYVDDMYKLYTSGMTLQEVGDQYGTTKSTIKRLFDKYNYPRRNKHDCHRKYTINEHYFDKIDSQEKAYIIGLLYADGTNCLYRNSIQIGLQESDKDVLEHISKLCGSNKPLSIVKSSYHGGQDIYRMDLVSEHMCNVLKDFGMVPNKSLTLTFPEIQNDIVRHFIRGYFDGDGYISKPEKPGCQIEIMGTLMFCESLKTILLEQDIDCYIKNTGRPETITRYLVIGKQNECKKFCEYIYNDATIYIKRKFEKAFKKFHSTFNLCTSNECA